MRIAVVCPYDLTVPGGVQSHVRELADRLRASGDEVTIVAPASQRQDDDVVAVGGTVGVRFNASVAPISLSPAAAARAVRAVRDLDADVVHVHEPAAPVVSLAVAARAPGPLVATFHAWSERSRLYRVARPLLAPAMGRLRARIAVSRPAAAYHGRALGLPDASFQVIPNGVDVKRFAAAEPAPALAGPGPLVLFVGRLERRKGPEQLVRAFVRLKARHPDVRLAVAGDGPRAGRCRELLPAPLRPDVRFLGRVAADDLPSLYAAADLFVAPALGGESFGIVLVEAMAAGVPVVASAIPGFESVIEDGRDGRLVPPGDVDALAAAIGALVDNPALREAFADQGRARASRYDWDVVAGEVRGIYDAVRRRGDGGDTGGVGRS